MVNNKLYIGILTGTSMDSIDCGIYSFHNSVFKEIAFYENDYPNSLQFSPKLYYDFSSYLIIDPKIS